MRTAPLTSLASCVALTVGLLACLSLPASAQNIVTNPGFEGVEIYPYFNGANFGPGWYHSITFGIVIETYGPSAADPSASFCHSGILSVIFACGVADTGSLFQSVSTTPGKTYTFDFWAGNDGDNPNPVDIYWDGQRIDTISTSDGVFTQHSYTVLATAATTEIKFESNMRAITEVYFDDVRVVANVNAGPLAAPEPGTLALVIGGGLGVGLLRPRRQSNP